MDGPRMSLERRQLDCALAAVAALIPGGEVERTSDGWTVTTGLLPASPPASSWVVASDGSRLASTTLTGESFHPLLRQAFSLGGGDPALVDEKFTELRA